MTNKDKIQNAIAVIMNYGQIGGDHHKAWVIDQVFCNLAGKDYEKLIAEYCSGEDGPNTYEWDKGIAP